MRLAIVPDTYEEEAQTNKCELWFGVILDRTRGGLTVMLDDKYINQLKRSGEDDAAQHIAKTITLVANSLALNASSGTPLNPEQLMAKVIDKFEDVYLASSDPKVG